MDRGGNPNPPGPSFPFFYPTPGDPRPRWRKELQLNGVQQQKVGDSCNSVHAVSTRVVTTAASCLGRRHQLGMHVGIAEKDLRQVPCSLVHVQLPSRAVCIFSLVQLQSCACAASVVCSFRLVHLCMCSFSLSHVRPCCILHGQATTRCESQCSLVLSCSTF